MGTKVETMSISLPPGMKTRLTSAAKAGGFASSSEIVRAALSDWLKAWEEREARIAYIRSKLDEGRAELDRGEGITVDDVDAFFAGIEAESKARKAKTAAAKKTSRPPATKTTAAKTITTRKPRGTQRRAKTSN